MAEDKKFLGSIPWFVQFLVLIGLVSVVWASLHFLVFAKTREETAQNQTKVEQLKRENDANQIVVGNLAAFEQSLEASRGELEELKGLLPEAVHTQQHNANYPGESDKSWAYPQGFPPA